MKRLLALLSILGLLLLPTSHAGAGEKRLEGSFTAEAVPVPHSVGWPAPCASRTPVANADGVNRVVEPFTTPFSGWLSIEARFSGDWDLALLDQEGRGLAWSEYQFYPYTEEKETLAYYLRKGQKVGIAVCNVASTSPVEVRYVLEASRAWEESAGKGLRQRSDESSYAAPSAGTKQFFVLCQYSLEVGCPASPEPHPSDRFVSVEISDASGGAVSAQVYQYAADSASYVGLDSFCTETDDPISLQPGVTHVGVLILLGSCDDGTLGSPTRGTYSVTFANRLPRK